VSELVSKFLVLQKIRVKFVSEKRGGVVTRRERFYVWEHDVVGHVLALEFCPKCEEVC
jgi:hypothetical protein